MLRVVLAAIIGVSGASLALGEESAAGEPVKTAPKDTRTRSTIAKTPTKTAAKKPAAKSRNTKIPAAATLAVKELVREFENGKLRTKSDYFTSNPNPEITADVVVALLSRKLGTSDSMDAYVKWQLLSAIGKEMPEQYAAEAAIAYRESPLPQSKVGLSDADKRQLDQELRRVDDPAELTGKLVAENRRIDMLNEPVIAYRDSLFSMLPDTVATFEAGLKDLYERGQAGITPKAFSQKLAERISRWTPEAQPADAEHIMGIVDELLKMPVPEYYDSVRSNSRDNTYSWQTRRVNIDDNKRLEDVATALERRTGGDDQRQEEPRTDKSRRR